MKLKQIGLWFGVMMLMGVIGFVAVGNTAAQTGPNLLQNPGFEEGHYNQSGISEITVPNGWKMHWLDGQDYEFTYQEFPAARPETVVWNGNNGASIPAGEEVFWRDGNFTVKLFKGYAPMYVAMSQDVSGLQVGRKYRFVAPIYTDIYEWENGKVYPTDPNHGLIRLGASAVGATWLDEGQIAYSGFWPASYGQYGLYVYDFTATQSDMTVWMEMVASYPHGNNGFFTDGASLQALDEFGAVTGGTGSTSSQPVETATPFPTPTPRADGAVVHVVQSGDNFWGLAIRYASVMNMTPEEALPAIQALNSDVQFLSPNMELMIVPPSTNGGSTAGDTGDTDGDTSGDDTTDGGTTTDDGDSAAPTATPEPTSVPVAISSDNPGADSQICLAVYDDANASATRDNDEALLGDAVLTISNDSGTVATYVTDGINEPYCFSDLPANTYQVKFSPPSDYQATTPINWAVTVADGVQLSTGFGAQYAPNGGSEIADANSGGNNASGNGEETSSDSSLDNAEVNTSGNAAPEAEDGGASNLGVIAIAIAIVLVLLAGAGVVLLRRS